MEARTKTVEDWFAMVRAGQLTLPRFQRFAITAGFEFDVPARFDTDELAVTLDIERLGSITSIPIIEVRE